MNITVNGKVIANNYHRVVIGGQGPYIELSKEHFTVPLHCAPDQEYRGKGKYAHCKYLWLMPEGMPHIKVYHQRRLVDYADYKVGMYYISPDQVEFDSPAICQWTTGPGKLGKIGCFNPYKAILWGFARGDDGIFLVQTKREPDQVIVIPGFLKMSRGDMREELIHQLSERIAGVYDPDMVPWNVPINVYTTQFNSVLPTEWAFLASEKTLHDPDEEDDTVIISSEFPDVNPLVISPTGDPIKSRLKELKMYQHALEIINSWEAGFQEHLKEEDLIS
jgi:hypothetical protein